MSKRKRFWFFFLLAILILVMLLFFPGYLEVGKVTYSSVEKVSLVNKITNVLNFKVEPVIETLDQEEYDQRMLTLANNPPPPPPKTITDPTTGEVKTVETPPVNYPWPKKDLPYPNVGAILPFKRVVAYYGNLYSKKMGVLGEYPEAEMFARLETEVKKWEEADPETPVQPALHYIVVVAQGSAGSDGKYRFRMPDSEIQKVLTMAAKIDAIVFLDIQVGLSNLQTEVPLLKKYLALPNVHLGIDPEFSMKTGAKPGTVVGTLDASDVNFTANFLADVVREYNLPPKILVVHRYTQKMLTNASLIKPLPEVQIVVHMDGWGPQAKKVSTYKSYVYKEPVQFTGFKLFYKNDLWDKGSTLFAPKDLMKLNPRPIYIQYQ